MISPRSASSNDQPLSQGVTVSFGIHRMMTSHSVRATDGLEKVLLLKDREVFSLGTLSFHKLCSFNASIDIKSRGAMH